MIKHGGGGIMQRRSSPAVGNAAGLGDVSCKRDILISVGQTWLNKGYY